MKTLTFTIIIEERDENAKYRQYFLTAEGLTPEELFKTGKLELVSSDDAGKFRAPMGLGRTDKLTLFQVFNLWMNRNRKVEDSLDLQVWTSKYDEEGDKK